MGPPGERIFSIRDVVQKIWHGSKAIFRSCFLIGCWVWYKIWLPNLEGLVSAFQNGMTVAYLLKNGRTIDQNLRSCVFCQNFDKTSGGYLGHLKPFFGATKGIDGCPLMGTQGFWRQKPILRTSFSQYHILSQSKIASLYNSSMPLTIQCKKMK